MKLFKSYTYKWWQMSILKLALFTIGAAIGAYWSEFFIVNLTTLIIIAVISTIYVLYISFKQ